MIKQLQSPTTATCNYVNTNNFLSTSDSARKLHFKTNYYCQLLAVLSEVSVVQNKRGIRRNVRCTIRKSSCPHNIFTPQPQNTRKKECTIVFRVNECIFERVCFLHSSFLKTITDLHDWGILTICRSSRWILDK